MKRIFAFMLTIVMVLSLAACGSSPAPAEKPNGSTPTGQTSQQPQPAEPKVDPVDINFGAGAMGGNYYIIAGAMKTVAESHCDAIKSMSVLAGSSSQFMAECQEGEVDMFMNTLDALYYGYAGTGQQGFPKDVCYDKSNFVTIMYNHLMLYVALESSPINNLSDITGKVAVPSPTMVGFTEDLLRACGVENPQVDAINDYNQMGQALKDGTYQVVMHGGPIPHSATVELAASSEIKAVSMTEEQCKKCIAEGPDSGMCQVFTIPAGSYDFLTEDYVTIGRAATITCSEDLNEEAVYQFTKAIYENKDEIIAVYAPMSEMTLDVIQDAANAGVIKVPIHPGAKRYYEEQGIKF